MIHADHHCVKRAELRPVGGFNHGQSLVERVLLMVVVLDGGIDACGCVGELAGVGIEDVVG